MLPSRGDLLTYLHRNFALFSSFMFSFLGFLNLLSFFHLVQSAIFYGLKWKFANLLISIHDLMFKKSLPLTGNSSNEVGADSARNQSVIANERFLER